MKKHTPMIVALIMSIIWVGFSGIYHYGDDTILLGLNILPLILWTIGLVTLYFIYMKVKGPYRFLKVTLFYVLALMTLESIGYHLLNIQLTSNYTGIFGLDVLHVPLYAKIYYMIAGPLYLLKVKYLQTRWGLV